MNYTKINNLLVFIIVNILLFVFVVRITILTQNMERPGFTLYVFLQLSAAIGMFLFILIQNQVPVSPALRDVPILLGICLYGLGILSCFWSVMPALSFAFAFQITFFIWILFYLMGYPRDFYTTEKYLIRLLVILLLFGLLRKPIVYGITPTLNYFLSSFHELNAGGISAALFSYCLAEWTASHAKLNPQRAKMLICGAIFAFLSLLISTSSGSNVSALVAIFLLTVVRRRWFLSVAVFLCVSAAILYPEIIDNTIAIIFPGKSIVRITNFGSRTVLWHDMWLLFQQRPTLGWGFATVERMGTVYASDSHNALIGILGGLGLVGAGFFVTFIFCTLARMYKLRHQIGYTGLLCAAVCMVVNSNTFGFLSGKTFILTIAFFALMSCGYWYQFRLSAMVINPNKSN